MGIADAKRYIEDLRRRQNDPYLWPDYLTGLPAKSAIIRKLSDIYPQIGIFAVAYVRIANIHPYLIKYGPDRHAEIIQWAAALLKTTCEQCPGCFVGTVSTHDFVVICKTKNIVRHLAAASRLFRRKVESFYTARDFAKKTTLTFTRDGQRVSIGLMRLVAAVADRPVNVPKGLLIQTLGQATDELESTDGDILMLGAEHQSL